MPVSQKRKKIRSTNKTKSRGNPLAHKNRPRVSGGRHPFDPDLEIIVPAPMVSKRRTPAGHVANLQAAQKDAFFALSALQIIENLSETCTQRLSKSSPENSPAQAIVELMMNRAAPKQNITEWLEKCYLGTWDEPHHAVENIVVSEWPASIPDDKKLDAYQRATQVFMIREHYFENGRVAVSFTKPTDPIDLLVVVNWILQGVPPRSVLV